MLPPKKLPAHLVLSRRLPAVPSELLPDLLAGQETPSRSAAGCSRTGGRLCRGNRLRLHPEHSLLLPTDHQRRQHLEVPTGGALPTYDLPLEHVRYRNPDCLGDQVRTEIQASGEHAQSNGRHAVGHRVHTYRTLPTRALGAKCV